MVDSPVNPLNKLKLDSWYMVLVPIGAIILLFAIITVNKELMMLGFGLFLVGIGEWKNNKYQFVEVPASAFTPYRSASIPIRKSDKLGNFLLILGMICLIIWTIGFFDIYHVIKP